MPNTYRLLRAGLMVLLDAFVPIAAADDAPVMGTCTKTSDNGKCVSCEFVASFINVPDSESREYLCPNMNVGWYSQSKFSGKVWADNSGKYGVKLHIGLAALGRDTVQGFIAEEAKSEGWVFLMQTPWESIPKDGAVKATLTNLRARTYSTNKGVLTSATADAGAKVTILSSPQ